MSTDLDLEDPAQERKQNLQGLSNVYGSDVSVVPEYVLESVINRSSSKQAYNLAKTMRLQ